MWSSLANHLDLGASGRAELVNYGSIIYVPNFGVIRLAEMVISKSARRLSMLYIDMEPPVAGVMQIGCIETGGIHPALVISGLSATLEATRMWSQFRDKRLAADEFEFRINTAYDDAEVQQESDNLPSLVPQPILDTMGSRAQRCWERYHEVLKGDYLPQEVDEAGGRVKKCLCEELQRIYDMNGSIPPGKLLDWWRVLCRPRN
jgi:hypothetical protein